MIKLHARLGMRIDAEPFIARVARGTTDRPPDPDHEVRFMEAGEAPIPGYRGYLVPGASAEGLTFGAEHSWPIPESLYHLSDGDIIRISPRPGELWVMYRRASPSNSMLLTERCNSYCIMCSQPPKSADDRYLVEAYLAAIPLMSPETSMLGITGGEPTLLGERLLRVIQQCKECLPATSVHMLSNGRLFNYLALSRDVAAIDHPALVVAIPLYSDIAHRHDFVVQADGAFDQTVRGIMNLARCGVAIEIRMVIHRETVERLPQFARFIARNLPFVDHVALMGLELMGFAPMNLDALWVDPVVYQAPLRAAVLHLQQRGLNVSIYNHQLCVLDRELWPFARKSISDWKNEYFDECSGCAAIQQCGGFFSSSSVRRSAGIRRLDSEALSAIPELSCSPSTG